MFSVSSLSAQPPGDATCSRTSPRPVTADELGRYGAEHGAERSVPTSPAEAMAKITGGYAELFGRHRSDRVELQVTALPGEPLSPGPAQASYPEEFVADVGTAVEVWV